MSNGAKVALAVGAGYMLGRTKKMRFALMLAAAGITGKFPTGPTQLVAHGLKSLGANADVSQLTEQLRGELLNAGRAAALSAATHQIDSLNDRLQGVTSAVGVDDTLEDVGGTVDGTLDGVGGLVGGHKRRRTRSERDDYVDEDDGYDEQDDEDDEEPLDVDEVDEDDEDDEDVDEDLVEEEDADDDLDDEDEEPEPPVTRRRAARRPSTPKKSVRGTKRTAARSTARRGR
jgi:hypothetical protein